MRKYLDKMGREVYEYNSTDRSEALKVSLTAIAADLGYTPERVGKRCILKEMDSLVIFNDSTWYRFSQKGNKTGGTQIDFLMEYGGAETVGEAINRLLEFKGGSAVEILPKHEGSTDKSFSMKLPEKNSNYKRLYAYLIKTRGISQETISDFIHRKLIYEDADHHNIVFLGRDPDGEVRYAGMRGTADQVKVFKCDVAGNDKNYGLNIINKDSDELKVFEGAIDLMSYIDMYCDKKSNKLVLGGVADNPLEQLLKDYGHIRKIVFCLDADQPGHDAVYGKDENGQHIPGLMDKYRSMGYEVGVDAPAYGKDFNEQLLMSKEIDQKIEQEMERFRPRSKVR